MNTKLSLTIGLVAGFGLVALLLQTHGPDASPVALEAAEIVEVAPELQPMVGGLPSAELPTPALITASISYPDGSSYPALNGVKEQVSLIWTSGFSRSFSTSHAVRYGPSIRKLPTIPVRDG